VSELRIDGDADHFGIQCLELFNTVVESQNFGRTDKCKVQRIEENNGIFAGNVVFQVEVVND
jgi:hypothetical protein